METENFGMCSKFSALFPWQHVCLSISDVSDVRIAVIIIIISVYWKYIGNKKVD